MPVQVKSLSCPFSGRPLYLSGLITAPITILPFCVRMTVSPLLDCQLYVMWAFFPQNQHRFWPWYVLNCQQIIEELSQFPGPEFQESLWVLLNLVSHSVLVVLYALCVLMLSLFFCHCHYTLRLLYFIQLQSPQAVLPALTLYLVKSVLCFPRKNNLNMQFVWGSRLDSLFW